MKLFKEGDRVYHYTYGWGEITTHEENAIIRVKFFADTIAFMDGNLLSFTEYTLQGFSQERPIILPEVGELCLVRGRENHSWSVRKFVSYIPNAEFPYVTEYDVPYAQMKRIKILD